jgi:sugar O-acyltransferase (sialic acid O-acetyltransferase NeuD family)
MRIAVYGIGGFGREVAPIVQEQIRAAGFDPAADGRVVFVDEDAARPAQSNGIPVIGFDDLCTPEHCDRQVVIALGDGRTRHALEQRCLAAGLRMADAIAPTARILHGNTIGEGAVLCDFVMITSNATIGRSFQGNIYSYVAHDCVIGDYVTFGPRVSCNGNVHIADFAYIGTGAALIQGKRGAPLTIGEGAIVGMGAVVTKPVEAYTVVAGNPARVLRTLERPT